MTIRTAYVLTIIDKANFGQVLERIAFDDDSEDYANLTGEHYVQRYQKEIYADESCFSSAIDYEVEAIPLF